jgi:type III restriction enzyme
VRGTDKSHISHVVLDSDWENMAAYHLELSPRVVSYAKNDRLDFEILYEWQGDWHRYVPDYLVRLDGGDGAELTLILEIKGQETEQTRAKEAAALKWCRAVNYHGGHGRWLYHQTKNPAELRHKLEEFPALAAPQVAGQP